MIPLCLLCISSLSSCWFFPPFSSPSLSSPLQCTPAIPVVPCGLWFADRAGRQRSLRVTRDKSCFSALRTDTSQLCSLQIAEICWLGGGGGLWWGVGGVRVAPGFLFPQRLRWKWLYHVNEAAVAPAMHAALPNCPSCLVLIWFFGGYAGTRVQ